VGFVRETPNVPKEETHLNINDNLWMTSTTVLNIIVCVLNHHILLVFIPVNQITVGLECYGVDPLLSENYWRGLTFFNSTIRKKSRTENVSASILDFVDIMYAGVNSTRNFTAALSASPNPPYLDNCRIMKNSFDGINFTEVRSEVIIRNSEISYNRGEDMA
jgi:hypothetical protein